MEIQQRPYNRESDFEKVYDSHDETFSTDSLFKNWPALRWEYMHFRPNLNINELQFIYLYIMNTLF